MKPLSRTLLAGLALASTLGCAQGAQKRSGAGYSEPATPALSEAEGDSAREDADLAFAREEEKLARDVYAALSPASPVFANIQASEQRHMDAVASLLATYGVPDPAADQPPGVFTDPALQDLYDALVAKGAASTADALAVGVLIEEYDIADLEARLANSSRPDVTAILTQLVRGSRNHLRAFYGQLTAAGGTYTPAYLPPDRFLAIATSPRERGPGAR